MSAERTDASEPPVEVGPYRILERIGSGGMGEVFLARDDRLGRQVAIKRLRTDRDPTGHSSERLRREARYAAGLGHPAIVQIHDILEQDHTLYVVMEWVEGEDLRRRLRDRGPLPLPEVIRIGRQLAGGLAAAHRRGIVHRDLKTENVLIDTEGGVKITDFGIAKRLRSGPTSSESEDALTEGEGVIGTFRVLSPEQVRGEKVEPRSDLFSFGILLYEALTGQSPFGEGNNATTLHRILESDPEPVESLRSDAPPGLASLVRRLLAKEPELRPRSAREVELDLADLDATDSGAEPTLDAGQQTRATPTPPETGATAAPEEPPATETTARRRAPTRPPLPFMVPGLVAFVLVCLWWLIGGSPWQTTTTADEAPTYVAVLPPVLRLDPAADPTAMGGASAEAEIFGEAVRVAMIRTLIDLREISPKAVDGRGAGGEGAGTWPSAELARSMGAEEVITASIFWQPELAQVTLERSRTLDDTVVWNETLNTSTNDPILVMRAIEGLLLAAYPDHPVRRNVPELVVEPDDLRRFLELRQRFEERLDPLGTETLDGLRALRASSPDFVDIDLQIVEIALHRFYDSRDPEHLEWAEKAILRASRLAPTDPRMLRFRVVVESEAGRNEAASAALEQLTETLPGDLQVEDLRARLLRKEGRRVEALELQRRVARSQPTLKRLVTLARLEIDLGEVQAAREHLEAAMARSAGNFEALSLLAQLELTVGDPTAAVVHYQRLVEQSPGTSELSNLGVGLMLLGRAEEAVAYFDRAAEIEPRNPFFLLNLSDAQWIAGDPARALEGYRRVVELIHQDPSADRPQFLTVEAQALAHLGEHRQAVAKIRRALALAPDSANVAYEAALVHALVGETTSALVQAEAAIEKGFEPRWFELPWFDPLEPLPEFRSLLGRDREAPTED